MDIEQEKHKKITIGLAMAGAVLALALIAIAVSSVIYLSDKIIQSNNQSLISPPEIVKFNLEKAEGLAK